MTTYPNGYGTPPQQLTIAEVAAKHPKLNPEFLRRVLAMMVGCPNPLGIGGGARSSAAQEVLFRSRYVAYTVPPGIRWDGSYWRKKDGVASAAPPGSSYHEDDIAGGALAVDMIGDLVWMKAACAGYGLREFSTVNSEPWHVQPAEIPASRSKWDGTPITATPPPTEDDDMPRFIYIAKPPASRAGQPWLVVADADVRAAISSDTTRGMEEVTIDDPDQYDNLRKCAGV